jgi:hypothetical protein
MSFMNIRKSKRSLNILSFQDLINYQKKILFEISLSFVDVQDNVFPQFCQ